MKKVTESFLHLVTLLSRENPAALNFLIDRMPGATFGHVSGICEGLLNWRRCGFPIAVLDSIEDAADLAETTPPFVPEFPSGGGEWAFEIGGAFVFYKGQWPDAPDDLSVEDQLDFMKVSVLVAGDLPFTTEQLIRIADNALVALTERPQGLSVTERRPSPKSARKRGRKYYPDVEYIIGSTSPLRATPTSTPERDGASEPDGDGWEMSVRTMVRGHWRQQPVGPRRSGRRATWIRPHWRGPEDAPISVHATSLPRFDKAG